MHILTAENITKSYSEKQLMDNISLSIMEGEKIGLIGINGTGKTTLLKIIAGIESCDSGAIISSKGLKIEFLQQNPEFNSGDTIIEHVFKGDSKEFNLIREYENTLYQIEQEAEKSKLKDKLISLSDKMDTCNAWEIESEAKSILTKLGVDNFYQDVGILSGGQRKRVALAASLIKTADLLILDEPTNHIDNDTVEWLEEYLNKRKGALLMITHDRYFLDRVVNRIVELDRGSLFSYQGNYSKFIKLKLEREESDKSSERKRQSLMRKELEWIKKGPKARGTKQKARIDRFNDMKENNPLADDENVKISGSKTRLGRKIIELNSISKGYDDKNLINDFTYTILRDDRIGIVGKNGIGKSTLLKIFTNEINPDSGTVDIGETVKIGVFSQESEEMDENLRVIEYIKDEAEFIETVDGVVTATKMLEQFLFPKELQWTPIKKLSGGEKRRLYLLRILMSAPNVLFLDEPTNDLDIQTLTVLESYIDEFNGAVIAVSHDRYFLDRVIDKVFYFSGNSEIKNIAGNYSDYTRWVNQNEKKEEVTKVKNKSKNTESNNKNKTLKFSFNEKREFDEIDGVILNIENDIEEVNKKINDSLSDFELLQELNTKQTELEEQLEKATERWVYLNELAEEIENNKNKKD